MVFDFEFVCLLIVRLREAALAFLFAINALAVELIGIREYK